MHGLPGQYRTAAADLRTALAYQPPHLSWYQLTIEPNTVFHKRPPLLPVEDALADIQDWASTCWPRGLSAVRGFRLQPPASSAATT